MSTQIEDDEMNETALKILAKSGPWAVVAGVLIGVFVFDVRVGLTEGRNQHGEILKAVEDIENIAGQTDMAQQQILYVLQTMCANAARTDDQRDNCQRRIDVRTR